jgi:hypothetical protein
LEAQQKVIQELARQLHTLRTRNRTLTDYEAMIAESGKKLIENREIVAGYAHGGGEPSVVQVEDGRNYDLLRAAVIAFLGESADRTDADLIERLNEVFEREEEDAAAWAEDEDEDVGDSEEEQDAANPDEDEEGANLPEDEGAANREEEEEASDHAEDQGTENQWEEEKPADRAEDQDAVGPEEEEEKGGIGEPGDTEDLLEDE